MDKVQTAVDPPNYTLLPTDLPVLTIKMFFSPGLMFLSFITLCVVLQTTVYIDFFASFLFGLVTKTFYNLTLQLERLHSVLDKTVSNPAMAWGF